MAELQAAMSSREFAEWIAYAGMEPIGEARADIRIGTLAALFAEANRDRKKRGKPYTVGEFVELFRGGESGIATPPKSGEARNDNAAELWANLKAWSQRGMTSAED